MLLIRLTHLFIAILLCIPLLGMSGFILREPASHELVEWAERKKTELRRLDLEPRSEQALFDEPYLLDRPAAPVAVLAEPARRRNAETLRLYSELIGSSRRRNFLWTGIESGNPLTRNEKYRWDSLADQGLFDADRRAQLIASLKSLGIGNIRLGLSNHRIDADIDASWKEHDLLIDDFARNGFNISLDLHHFGIEDRFRVTDSEGRTVGASSYYLNPAWPDYFARFAARALQRYSGKIKAITLINEPETTVGFNSEMWHGAFPRWGNPRNDYYYVERAVQVAKAAVKARIAIEAEMRRSGTRVLFLHPEAAVYKPSWDDFNRFNRFLPSDLILGHDWLMEADLAALARRPMAELVGAWRDKPADRRSQLDWLIQHYIIRSQPPAAWEDNRQRLVRLLGDLQAIHRALNAGYCVTMRSDTVFGVDYYAHNEDRDGKGVRLDARPEFYDGQVRSHRRAGLHRVLIDYYDRYQLPMMISETGTPYHHYGMRWHQQMLLACADAMIAGVPLLGYALYPAIDTWGWEAALSVPKSETLLNPGGLLDLEGTPKPFVERLLASLSEFGLSDIAEQAFLSSSDPDLPARDGADGIPETAPL